MGGLLDKANDYKDSVHQGDNVGSKVVNDPSAIISAYEMGKNSGDAKENKDEKLETKNKEEEVYPVILEESFDNGLNKNNLIFQLSSGGIFLVTMIMVFFFDTTVLFSGFTLDDLLVPGVILSWIVFNWEKLSQKEFDTKILAVSGVSFILLTAVFGGVSIFTANESAVKVGNVEFDGVDNEIDIKLFGPKGSDFTMDILVDGVSQYTYESSINVDRASHSVSLHDFWNGNSMDMNDKVLKTYEVEVISDGGTDTFDFTDHMVREANAGFVRVSEIFETASNGDKTYNGITVELLVGIGNPVCPDIQSRSSNCSFYDYENGAFTGTTPQPIATDWTVSLDVKLGSTVKYSYSSITADEGVVGGLGEFAFDWVMMPGTQSNYLDRSDFYNDDGCYTFEVTIENEHGDTFTDSSSKLQFYWDDNEANSDDTDQMAVAC